MAGNNLSSMKTSDIVLLFAAVAAFPVLFINAAIAASVFFALGIGSLVVADYSPRLAIARACSEFGVLPRRRTERLGLAA
jgi:hypothetical protein